MADTFDNWLRDRIQESTGDRKGAFREVAAFRGLDLEAPRQEPEERFRVGHLNCERFPWTAWVVVDGCHVSECDTRIPGHGCPVVRVAVPFRGEPTIEIDAEDGHVDWPIEQALRGFANERIEEAAQ